MRDKVIVITGASAGIGATLAEKCGALGARVVLAARSKDALESVARKCGPQARAVVTDVRRRADVDALRDAALRAFGHVDVWVNNAGRGISKPVLELSDEDIDEMMSVNLKSALYGMQAIVPHFKERGQGHLINVSSFLGRVPLASIRSAYNAAKHALNALTANLRMDLAESAPGVHVSLCMPGIVTTDFARNALGGTPATHAPARAAPSQTPEEVADVLVRLIQSPVPEVYTNPAQREIALAYFQDVGAFEARLRQG